MIDSMSSMPVLTSGACPENDTRHVTARNIAHTSDNRALIHRIP